ncbi:movement protein [Citrus leprosis virus N]|uniref:Movement protein n=1 Tax=Citrus leprosis virus N TaxID=1956177 RepID=A0A1S5VFF1_9RHAB|nr:movement protein [Citrus leprosis virus N]AQN78363.1 movement protein [Citrus leprosis virus N]
MSTLPASTIHGAPARNEVLETAHRRMGGRSSDVEDFNKTLQTAEAWQKKLIQKHPIKITGKEGEGRVTMIRRPLVFNIMNAASNMLSIGNKPIWIVGIAIKWVPSCDLATSGTLTLSLLNKAVTNPVLRDNTVMTMTQRVATPFEVQYTSSSKHSGGTGNPWMYSYEVKNMDDAPDDMEMGTAIIMPMIRVDEKASQVYGGVQCSVYGGYFPLNVPVVTYCAPGPRFKTNLKDIMRNVEMLKRYLGVQGFTDLDDDLIFHLIQTCDPDTAKIITEGISGKVWAPLKSEEDRSIIKSLIYDCRTGRAVAYITLKDITHLGTMGGDKKFTYT